MATYSTTHRYARYLAPSWLSGIISIGLPLVIACSAFVMTRIQGPILQREMFAIQHAIAPVFSLYYLFINIIDNTQYAINIPMILFWAVVGLMFYILITGFMRLFGDAIYLEREMHYVHSEPGSVIKDVLARITIRFVSAITLTFVLSFTIVQLIPDYVRTVEMLATYVQASDLWHLLFDGALLFASFVVQTELLRLLFLRVRVLGGFIE